MSVEDAIHARIQHSLLTEPFHYGGGLAGLRSGAVYGGGISGMRTGAVYGGAAKAPGKLWASHCKLKRVTPAAMEKIRAYAERLPCPSDEEKKAIRAAARKRAAAKKRREEKKIMEAMAAEAEGPPDYEPLDPEAALEAVVGSGMRKKRGGLAMGMPPVWMEYLRKFGRKGAGYSGGAAKRGGKPRPWWGVVKNPKKCGSQPYVAFLKAYAKKHRVTYGQAMSDVSRLGLWRKKCPELPTYAPPRGTKTYERGPARRVVKKKK